MLQMPSKCYLKENFSLIKWYDKVLTYIKSKNRTYARVEAGGLWDGVGKDKIKILSHFFLFRESFKCVMWNLGRFFCRHLRNWRALLCIASINLFAWECEYWIWEETHQYSLSIIHSRQRENSFVYIFAEFEGEIKKFNYSLGAFN